MADPRTKRTSQSGSCASSNSTASQHRFVELFSGNGLSRLCHGFPCQRGLYRVCRVAFTIMSWTPCCSCRATNIWRLFCCYPLLTAHSDRRAYSSHHPFQGSRSAAADPHRGAFREPLLLLWKNVVALMALSSVSLHNQGLNVLKQATEKCRTPHISFDLKHQTLTFSPGASMLCSRGLRHMDTTKSY